MRIRLFLLGLVLFWLLLDREFLLLAPSVRRIQQAAASDLEVRYVDRSRAPELGAYLRRRRPEWVTLGPWLAARLGEELRAQSGDLPFGARYNWAVAELSPVDNATAPPPSAKELAEDAADGWGMGPVTVADGTATVAIRRFGWEEPAAGAVEGVFRQVAGARALVLDLRECQGGVAGTALLWASYLFGRQVHWATLQYRGFTEEYWTLPRVAGPRFDGPVTVLVGSRTMAACEGFAYHLQARRRAAVLGERTAGAAHYAVRRQVTDHIAIELPEARASDPETGTNWQGGGVAPDGPGLP
ncbi:MAG: S41 family peptidase [Acidobacteria bacterium]|nr:S41 family peptidase [Acidobacteriota bacterium]